MTMVQYFPNHPYFISDLDFIKIKKNFLSVTNFPYTLNNL